MKALEDFEGDLGDAVFERAYELRKAGTDYYDFCRILKKERAISYKLATEIWAKVNEFIAATLNLSPEAVRSELILKAQAIQKDAKDDKAHGARVSALKLEIDLRVIETNEVETVRHEHYLTLAEPEPENELNEELKDEI